MNVLKLEYNTINYNLHMVDSMNYNTYKSLLNDVNICNPEFLDKLYESLSYISIEDDTSVGFFLSDNTNTIIYSSTVVDLECNQNKDIIIDNGYAIVDSVELTLLCSNYKQRIPGLTKYFIDYVITNLLKIYKPNVKHIFLHVGKGIEFNRNAYDFYIRFGFKPLSTDNPNILLYTFNGGKNKNKRKIRNKTKFRNRITNKKVNKIKTKKRRL